MENPTVADSNSESEISDSWAVIDDDSSLEWNNVISKGLRSPQYFPKSRIPRSSISKGELTDDDSIEVVPEDHDDIGDKEPEAEVVQDEEWTEPDQLESRKTIFPETCRRIPDEPHCSTQVQKKNLKWRESNPILITILIMGIVGGLGFGYLWASHFNSEDSSYIQPTRASLTKLENEIQFLRRQLRSAQSSLRSAAFKTIPKLKHVTKQDLHTNTKGKLFKNNHPGMCSVTDVILKSLILQDNVSKEYCPASDRPQANENDWTSRSGNMSVNIAHTSSSSNTSATKKQLKVNTGINTLCNNKNELNGSSAQYIPYLAKQINQAFQESNKKGSSEPLDIVQHVNTSSEAMYSLDVIAKKPSGTHVGNEKIISGSDKRSDPRPYSKLRTTVERIYTILSVIHNENQTVLPSQLELLSILSQNIVALNIKGHFTTNVLDKISSYTVQMQETTQKLFTDIESSINNFVQHVAFKVKEIETVNKKQICNLKTSLESSAGSAVLDLNHEPIFQICIEENKQNNNDGLFENGNKHEVKDPLPVSKEVSVVGESGISGGNEPSERAWMVNGKEYFYRQQKHKNKNVQQHLKFGETSSVFVNKKGIVRTSDLNKKFPKINKNVVENISHLKESTGRHIQTEEGTYPNRVSRKDHSDRKMKPKIVKATKNNKSGAKYSDLPVNKMFEKSGVKKKFGNKVNKEDNESRGKGKKNIKKSAKVVNTNRTNNVSGEWAMKMAFGRAEQRHRGHQSDWVFERAKARMSNRKKSIKESYWRNDRGYCSTILNCNVYNNSIPVKDQTSKSWKDIKQGMKKTLWKPLIDSAKSVKKAFYKFNNKIRHHQYHSRQE